MRMIVLMAFLFWLGSMYHLSIVKDLKDTVRACLILEDL